MRNQESRWGGDDPPHRDRPLISREQLRRLSGEVASAARELTTARAASKPLETLRHVTLAIEELTATQHELVNVLLDNGRTWSEVGEALSISAGSAERRYPRRARRDA